MVAKVPPYKFDPLSRRMVLVFVFWVPQNSFAFNPVGRQGFFKKKYHVVLGKRS